MVKQRNYGNHIKYQKQEEVHIFAYAKMNMSKNNAVFTSHPAS